MRLIDLTGQKFGRLTVLCREGTYQRPSGNKEPTWRCVCECGNEVVVQSSNLKKRNTLSCGCLQAENRKVPRRETEYDIRGDVAYVRSFDGVEFIINTCDLDTVLNHRWHRNGNGYMADEHGNTLHRVLMKPPAVMDVHHINENKLDNRRINLLMLSRSEHTALHQRKDFANGVTVQEQIRDHYWATEQAYKNGKADALKWIPVTERLPEEWTDVLVLSEFGFCEVAVYIGTPGKWRVCWNHTMLEDNSVTHWMPLPEPPEGA